MILARILLASPQLGAFFPTLRWPLSPLQLHYSISSDLLSLAQEAHCLPECFLLFVYILCVCARARVHVVSVHFRQLSLVTHTTHAFETYHHSTCRALFGNCRWKLWSFCGGRGSGSHLCLSVHDSCIWYLFWYRPKLSWGAGVVPALFAAVDWGRD